jgi:RNA polymerase sigma factor (sigma-70 family)
LQLAPGSRRLQRLDDDRLAALVRAGDDAAFEALYDRHQPSLLAFCRHMVGNREDGEDALQQTFLRAHRALTERRPPDAVRPWLFAIARNRCRTLLAARRDAAVPVEELEPSFDGLADDVRRRADLRELLADLARLPEDQRGALVLAELGDLSHTDIATVIGCPPTKVKALVFQARTALIAERNARSTPCEDIRGQLELARGGVLRRGPLRRHLRQCDPCRAYQAVVARQRAALAWILPVAPSAGLKAAVLGGAGASGAGGTAAAIGIAGASGAAGTGAVLGGVGIKGLVATVAVTATVAGAGVSGAVPIGDPQPPNTGRERPAADPRDDDPRLSRAGLRVSGDDAGPAAGDDRPPSPSSGVRTVADTGAVRARPRRRVRRAARVLRRARRAARRERIMSLTTRRRVRRAARIVRRARLRQQANAESATQPPATRRARRERRRARRHEETAAPPEQAPGDPVRPRRRRQQPAGEPDPEAETPQEPEDGERPRRRHREPEPGVDAGASPEPEPTPEPTATPEPTPTPSATPAP